MLWVRPSIVCCCGPSLPPWQLHTFLPRVIEYSNAETPADDKLFSPSKKHSIVSLTNCNTAPLVCGELRPFAPVARWPGHVTSVTHGAWRVTGHWSAHHTNISNNHTLHYNNNISSQEISNLWQNWYIVTITSVLSFSTIGVNYCEAKRILCEFVTEIRHTVIVTKSVISHGSVIRGTMPRHNITLWQCDPSYIALSYFQHPISPTNARHGQRGTIEQWLK